MYFQVDNLRFEKDEVECNQFLRRRTLGPNGMEYSEIRTLLVTVDQVRYGQRDNSTRFQQIIDSIKNPLVAQFLEDDLTPTPLVVKAAGSLTGLKLITPPSFSPRDEVEYATHLTIPIGFEAEYLLSGVDQMVDYQESITLEDEGPVRTVPLETDTGNIEYFVTCQKPIRYVTQEGFAIARDAYPVWNAPFLPVSTMIQRMQGRITPIRMGLNRVNYRVAWRYVFAVQDGGDWFPVIR